MKAIRQSVLFTLLFVANAPAQPAINWSTIDGGGGTSVGGGFALSGTIGQPDAGRLSGGAFVLHGGFWAPEHAFAAPTLFITRNGVNAIVRWEPAVPGFVLQQSTNLSEIGWADAPSGGTNPANVPAGSGRRFYRLRQ